MTLSTRDEVFRALAAAGLFACFLAPIPAIVRFNVMRQLKKTYLNFFSIPIEVDVISGFMLFIMTFMTVGIRRGETGCVMEGYAIIAYSVGRAIEGVATDSFILRHMFSNKPIRPADYIVPRFLIYGSFLAIACLCGYNSYILSFGNFNNEYIDGAGLVCVDRYSDLFWLVPTCGFGISVLSHLILVLTGCAFKFRGANIMKGRERSFQRGVIRRRKSIAKGDAKKIKKAENKLKKEQKKKQKAEKKKMKKMKKGKKNMVEAEQLDDDGGLADEEIKNKIKEMVGNIQNRENDVMKEKEENKRVEAIKRMRELEEKRREKLWKEKLPVDSLKCLFYQLNISVIEIFAAALPIVSLFVPSADVILPACCLVTFIARAIVNLFTLDDLCRATSPPKK